MPRILESKVRAFRPRTLGLQAVAVEVGRPEVGRPEVGRLEASQTRTCKASAKRLSSSVSTLMRPSAFALAGYERDQKLGSLDQRANG